MLVKTAAWLLPIGALVLAGCGEQAANPGAEPSLELQDSSLVAGAYANPLDAIEYPDTKQQEIITQAVEKSMTSCMAELNFTYVAGDGYGRWTTAESAQYIYSVTDPKVAAVYGFHPEKWVKRALALESGAATQARPEGYEVALYGDFGTDVLDSDGTVIAKYDPLSCQGKAKDALMPEWAEQDRLIDVSGSILAAIDPESDERVVAAQKEWSTCMAESGYDFSTPMVANNTATSDLPTEEEIPLAVASAKCQHSSGLLRTWSQVRAEQTQVELDKHPGIIAEFTRIQNETFELAQ